MVPNYMDSAGRAGKHTPVNRQLAEMNFLNEAYLSRAAGRGPRLLLLVAAALNPGGPRGSRGLRRGRPRRRSLAGERDGGDARGPAGGLSAGKRSRSRRSPRRPRPSLKRPYACALEVRVRSARVPGCLGPRRTGRRAWCPTCCSSGWPVQPKTLKRRKSPKPPKKRKARRITVIERIPTKGKPGESRGRKAMGPKAETRHGSPAAGEKKGADSR